MLNTLEHIKNSNLNKPLKKRESEIRMKIVRTIAFLRNKGLWINGN